MKRSVLIIKKSFNLVVMMKSKHGPGVIVATALMLLPVIYFYPAVKGDFVLMMGDGWAYNILMSMFSGALISQGEIPLWNSHIFAGTPHLAAIQTGALYPPNWLYAILPPGAAMNAVVISTYQIAIVGSYLFGRRIGMVRIAALVTAVTFTFSGFMVAQFDQTNSIAAYAWLPWVLLAIERLYQRLSWRWIGLGATFIALQTFAGLPQATFLTALLSGAYVVFCLTLRGSTVRPIRFGLAILLMAICGAMFSAIQLLPARELQLQGDRAQISYEFFSHWSMPPRRLFALVFPNFFGGGLKPFYSRPAWDSLWSVRWAHGYTGIVGLLLAFVALFESFRRRMVSRKGEDYALDQNEETVVKPDALPFKRSLIWFWGSVAGVSLLLALGHYMPFGLNHLLYRITPFNLFRGSFRHLVEYSFAIAMLAGLGTSMLTTSPRKQAYRALLPGAITIASVVSATLAAYLYFNRAIPVENPSLAPTTSLKDAEALIPMIFFLLSIAAVWFYMRRRSGLAGVVLVITLLLDLASFGYCTEWRTVGWKMMDTFADSPAVAYVKSREADLQSFRVLDRSIGDYSLNCADLNCQNMSIARGLQSCGGYEPMRLSRVADVAGEMSILGRVTDTKALGVVNQGLNLLNVRYVFHEKLPIVDDKTLFTVNHNGIPFKQNVMDIKMSPGGRREMEAYGIAASDLGIVSTLVNSAHVPEGTVVAHIKFRLKDGRLIERELRAGRDTSEWAWDRNDVRSVVKHQRAKVIESWPMSDEAGGFQGHRYLARFPLDRPEIESVEMEYAHSSGELIIERMSLYDSATGKVIALDTLKLPRERWRKLASFGLVEIYENLNCLPRAWFVNEVAVAPSGEVLKTIREGGFSDGRQFNPAEIALLEREDTENKSPESPQVSMGGKAEVKVVSHRPQKIELRTSNERPRFLVLSEIYYPGWKAFIDGVEAPVYRTDYILRGVLIPSGEHRVEFKFMPQSFYRGALYAGIGALILLIGAALSYRKNERQPPPSYSIK